MYYKLDSEEFKKIEKAINITGGDYDLLGEFIPAESLVSMVEDLLLEIDRLEEKHSDLEKVIEEDYELKPFNPYSEYGVSEKDFL